MLGEGIHEVPLCRGTVCHCWLLLLPAIAVANASAAANSKCDCQIENPKWMSNSIRKLHTIIHFNLYWKVTNYDTNYEL